MIDQQSLKKYGMSAVFLVLNLILASSSCAPQTKPQDPHNVSLTRSYRNSFLWKQVKKDPAVFHPKALPSGYAINQKTGEWIVDPQTQASFFVPYREIGGLSPAVLRKEANKAVYSLDKTEPRSEFSNGERVAIAILTLPLYALSGTLSDDDDDDWFTESDCPSERRRKDKKKDDCPPSDDNDPDDDQSDEDDKCDKPSEGQE